LGGKPIEAPTPMKIVEQVTAEHAAHEPFLRAAIDEARKGLAEGGLPIGSVLVRGDQIIGAGHNRRVQSGNPMAHAEIDALTNAGRQKTYRDTVLYSTLMPCYLCSGAAVQFRVPKIVVGESVNFPGASTFMRSRGIDVLDMHDAECIRMMADFIRDHPDLWHEDIGEK
jgi:creatinine deaminase